MPHVRISVQAAWRELPPLVSLIWCLGRRACRHHTCAEHLTATCVKGGAAFGPAHAAQQPRSLDAVMSAACVPCCPSVPCRDGAPAGPRAQRSDVVVDACVVGGADSAFLQQAAHLTGGLYLRPPRPGGLLQTLLVRRAAPGGAPRLQHPAPAAPSTTVSGVALLHSVAGRLLGHQPAGCQAGVVGEPGPGPGTKRCRRARLARPGPAQTGAAARARADGVLLRHLLARLPGPAARERGRLPRLLLLPQGGAAGGSHGLARGRVCLCNGFVDTVHRCFNRLAGPGRSALPSAVSGSPGPWSGRGRLGASLCGSLFDPVVAGAGPACSRGSSVSRARRPAAPASRRSRGGR